MLDVHSDCNNIRIQIYRNPRIVYLLEFCISVKFSIHLILYSQGSVRNYLLNSMRMKYSGYTVLRFTWSGGSSGVYNRVNRLDKAALGSIAGLGRYLPAGVLWKVLCYSDCIILSNETQG